ncbi:acyl-CoA dehydrogenase [Microbispora cellulosiformans]|uniref:Acyl-CoA dehydrogenase n=1 Tax=Microbispora cellulosiformans TaxID=2614688 RepID=A0A5J5K1K4_9ACTN|nr:acyl-CoA dehydrogenase family protein [Microbispora cellulosiformans]KAA9377618.1 acyl-CoA dehydrogenase [Microbispora cellulosiformans]
MDIATAPTRDELVRRASELVPLLQKHASWAEENRRLPDEVVEAIADAGLLRLRVPARYGGYECDTRTVVDVVTELARGDASTGWTFAVWSICSWLTGLFPDEVQDEVFATPDVRVSGLLSPGGAATPADGGLTVNGRWAFNTGALHSEWNSIVAMAPTPDGAGQWPVLALVPVSDLEIVDDWHTSGLRASGSVTTVARDLFVPMRRVLPMGPVLQEHYASERNAATPVYRTPMLPTAATSTVGTVLGLARAAREVFFERLPGRKITYTAYESQREAPITHLKVAKAAALIDEAEFHAHRAAALLDHKSAAGEEWEIEERARIRLDLGCAYERAKEAVDVYNSASGASSVYTSVPMQRIARDAQTLNLHAILHPDTNYELYGRVLCGLEPNTLYI